MMNIDVLRDEKFYSGITYLKQTDDGVAPRRISKDYLSFCDRAEPYRTFGRTCASVKLRFSTDARTIRLCCRYQPFTPGRCTSDLYVDDRYHSSFGPKDISTDFDGVIFSSDEAKLRRFQIYFHYNVDMTLRSIGFEDATVVEPQPGERRVWLALGDSITQGADAQHPADSFVETAARLLDVDTINLGIGGEKMEPEHAQYGSGYKFDFVTVAYGANDCGFSVPVHVYLEKARQAADTLIKLGKPVVFISPVSIPGEQNLRNSNGHRLQDFREAILILTRERKELLYVDGKDLLPPDPQFFFDGLHPNRAGHIHYGKALADKLQQIDLC